MLAAAGVLLFGAVGGLTGCGSKQKPAPSPAAPPAAETNPGPPAPSARTRPAAWVDLDPPALLSLSIVEPGQTAIVPLTPTAREIAAGSVRIRRGPEGWPERAPLVRLSVGLEPDTSTPASAAAAQMRRRWLGLPTAGPTSWRAERANRAELADGRPGFWVAAIDVPASAARGRSITLGLGESDASASVAVAPVGQRTGWNVPRESNAGAIAWAREIAAAPWDRWRADVLGVSIEPDEDPVLAAIGRQVSAGVLALLNRVNAADPDLRDRLVAALAVRLTPEVAPPVPLPPVAPDVVELAQALRDPGTPTARVIEVVRAALDRRRGVGAWVISDAPAQDATGGARAQFGVISLADEPVAVTIDAPAMSAPEVLLAGPLGVQAASVVLEPPAGPDPELLASSSMPLAPAAARTAATPTADFSVRADGLDLVRTAVPRPVPVTPPGADVGPLLPDWSASTLLIASSHPGPTPPVPAPAAGDLVRGRLYAELVDARPAWRLLLECAAAPGGAEASIEIHMGPAARPVATWRVDASGRMESAGPGLRPTASQSRLDVVPTDQGWSIIVPIPEGAIETLVGLDGRPAAALRIGLVRRASDGARHAWPRAMLPWHDTAPRAVFDLSAWSRTSAR